MPWDRDATLARRPGRTARSRHEDPAMTSGRGTRPIPRADPPTPPQAVEGEGLDDDQLRRLAVLVAVGEAPEPEDLATPQHARLAGLVRELRRDRLMNLIARCVAVE